MPDSLKQIGLYIHIPWCAKKCPYCDFNSHALESRKQLKDNLPEQDYIHALARDLETHRPFLESRKIKSIFFGGGTPSLFSAEAIEQIILLAKPYLDNEVEITLEANPGTVEQEKFQEFKAAGINRLSIGIQSFNPDHLEKLGRIHNHKEAIKAAEAAHYAGLDNFNLDLMFGLPQQNLQQALHDVQTAIDLEPAHISHYQLTIEPETAFYKQPPVLPDDDFIWQMQTDCQSRLSQHGYSQYEISAYARNERQCQHNMNYWQFGDYIGIGAGAHGKYTENKHIQRISKVKAPFSFMKNAGNALCKDEERLLSEADTIFEFLLNALRLNKGFLLSTFESRTHLKADNLLQHMAPHIASGLIEHEGDYLRASTKGRTFLNSILSDILPETTLT